MTTENKTSAVEQIQKQLHELQSAQKKALDDNSSHTKQQIDEIANSIAQKTATLQEQLQKQSAKQEALETLLNRPANDNQPVSRKEEQLERLSKFLETGKGGDMDGGKASITLSQKSLNTGNDEQGGYLVAPEVMLGISQRIFETSPLRAVANVVQMNSKVGEYVLDDDKVSGGWLAEEGTAANTNTPTLGKVRISLNKLYANPKVSQEMLKFGFVNVEQWLQRKVADELARIENTAFVSGNGAGRPRGFLTYDAWAAAGTYEANKLEQVNSGSSGAVTINGAIDLQNALHEPYQARAVWMMKRATLAAYLKLKDADNGYYLLPSIAENGGLEFNLLGKRVILADDMPTVAADALSVAYGDFGAGYTIADGDGIEILRDPYSTKGSVEYFTTKFVGGGVNNFEAIKLQKLAA